MQDNPKISVIMPVYNTEESYFRQAIESILKQNYMDLELIIVDDGSTNNSKEVAESYNDERIVYFYQKNKGLSGARNSGMKIAKGEYITFVDSDDWLDKDSLLILYEKAKKDDLDVLFFGINSYDNITKKINPYNGFMTIANEISDSVFDFRHPKIYSNLFKISHTAWAKLFKKNFLIDNNLFFEESLIFEDFEFFFRYIIRAKKIAYIKELFYYYRINVNNSIILVAGKNHFDILKVFTSIEKVLSDNNLIQDLRIQFYQSKFANIEHRYKNIDKKYKKEFKKLIKQNFKSIRMNKPEFKKLSKHSQRIYNEFIYSRLFILIKRTSLYCRLYY